MEQHVYRLKDVDFARHQSHMRKAAYVGHDIMLIHWIIEPTNPRTGIHWHSDNEQFGVILEGQAELTIGNERVVMGPGDVYWAPKNLPHGETLVLGDTPLHILDVFSPPREDYIPKPAEAAGTSSGNVNQAR